MSKFAPASCDSLKNSKLRLEPSDNCRDPDELFMLLALEEAKRAWRISPPNPSVGAVIVRDGRIIASGFTQQAGGPHAEIMALRDAKARGESVEGATIYVTLEPCSHYGRTPPCAKALIEAKVGRVIAAIGDPNPQVHGRGMAMIEAAGIQTRLGVLADQAREVNAGFFSRMTRGMPWVRMKTAVTLDGRTALADGRSKWITGEAARADGQFWRARAGAVVTGIGTVLADDPQMNVRLEDQIRQPLRVVADPQFRTPVDAKIIRSAGGATIIAGLAGQTGDACRRADALRAAGAEVLELPSDSTRGIDLRALLIELASREVNEVHLEAGAGLSGAFLNADLVDELLVYEAPCFFGEGAGPALVSPPDSPAAARRWRVHSLSKIGEDFRIICRRN